MYGEPVIPSGGPSGRTCHHRCPAAASQSTKRRACSSSTPFGSDVGCSRIPDARFSFMRLGPAPRRECHATVPLPKSTTPRIQIQAVEPIVDCGRYPVKATVGDTVAVYATVFKDGHDTLAGAVRFKGPGDRRWREAPLDSLGNDRWGGTFSVDRPGRWQFAVAAWTDRGATWQHELQRKTEAGQTDLAGELSEGAFLLGRESLTVEEGVAAEAGDRHDDACSAAFEVDVDRELARFGSWYELFPRSWGGFEGVRKLLPGFADLAFDVLYLPPFHPFGPSTPKAPTNTPPPGPKNPGSPWPTGAAKAGT